MFSKKFATRDYREKQLISFFTDLACIICTCPTCHQLYKCLQKLKQFCTMFSIFKDMSERADLVVMELFDTELIGEGLLLSMRHAYKHLLKVAGLKYYVYSTIDTFIFIVMISQYHSGCSYRYVTTPSPGR